MWKTSTTFMRFVMTYNRHSIIYILISNSNTTNC